MADMKLSEELQWRGFVNQKTVADLQQLDAKKFVFYQGFDASAPSQTVGNLAFMMMARVFMRHGHKAVILAGGATSLIGDPGGKDVERPLQDEKTISHNVKAAEKQLKQVFSGYKFRMVNNLDWTKNMSVITFLRDIGKHFSMTPLVQRDYIAKRIGNEGVGISYTEFSYTLLQGMDYLHLYDKFGVTLQLGGADQWGNCLSGVDLVRKARGAVTHAITMPLVINKATGKKFGKSEEGAVWLDPQKTSPTQFYQFWINIDDEGVEYYLKIFTELKKDQIEDISIQHRLDPKKRYAQKRLAEEVTNLVHGDDRMLVAQLVTDCLMQQSVGGAGPMILKEMRKEIPSVLASPGLEIAELLVQVKLASSKTEARRLIAENAVSINGFKTKNQRLEKEDFDNGRLLIRKGKAFKDSALVERA